MVYRFILINDEVEDFLREIQIDAESSFLDFHHAILESVNFPDNQMTSFFLCEDNWEKTTEITLEDMDLSSEEDNYVMEKTPLNELVEDEQQKLVYVFDPLTERCFFIELVEIICGKDLIMPKCTQSKGKIPAQSVDLDDFTAKLDVHEDLGENFYGDESYNADDFDPEGFDIADESSLLN